VAPARESLDPPATTALFSLARWHQEIAAVEGGDVLFVGPADLAFDLSVRRSGDDGAYDDCLEKVAVAAHAAGKQAGILVRSLEDIPALKSRGFTHFAVESDIGILRSRYQQVLKATRELCA
jgi:2-dehydro-3-deoxyglucarate aldolase/4-hydroxy-2-oxoheptanedioate aldolase